LDLEEYRETYERIVDEVTKVVVGQDRAVRLLLTCIMADGHAILTGVPGLGRTLIGETMGKALGLSVNRIQFTPDLLPTDVTGTEVIELRDGRHHRRYVPGPVFANMVLADEINRSPSRTQSALLEAMQERQVTVNGQCRRLQTPFLVIATQNSLDTEGVYRLPEAQLDRFMMQIEMVYPTEDDEVRIVDATTSTTRRTASAVTDAETVLAMQHFARSIPVTKTVKVFVAQLVRSSRWEDVGRKRGEAEKVTKRHWWGGKRTVTEGGGVARYIRWGASPRAGQALLRAAKVRAIVEGRSYVVRGDVIAVSGATLAHRVLPDHRAGAKGLTSQHVLEQLVEEVETKLAPQPTSSRMRSLLTPMEQWRKRGTAI
jgi:MoxR-like ATPase